MSTVAMMEVKTLASTTDKIFVTTVMTQLASDNTLRMKAID